MPKTATVTISVTVTAEVPKSWTEDDALDKMTEALDIDVKSSTKRVTITDVEADVDEVELDEEEED